MNNQPFVLFNIHQITKSPIINVAIIIIIIKKKLVIRSFLHVSIVKSVTESSLFIRVTERHKS